MADFPALPVWTDAYLADTRHLSCMEHGAYFLLLQEAWRRPTCSLPDNDTLLAKLCGLDADTWAEIRANVMAFWKLDRRSHCWTQKRLTKEHKYVKERRKSQRDKAAKRWKKTTNDDAAADAEAMPEGMPKRSRKHAPTPTPTPTVSVPNGTGAEAPQIDLKKLAYDEGKALLVAAGISEKTAGGLISKWIKSRGEQWTVDAIRSAEGKDQPIPWIEARMKAAHTVEDEARAMSAATAARYRAADMGEPPEHMKRELGWTG